ncbi:MAG: heavy-metal-associated domain-containing protein [Chlorobium sp.]|jgi:copper chaperone|nr:MAG: heavy-metal-associated domain-containing protein [Chlorobium sp.]
MKNEIQVSGMNCPSCEMLVREALEDLEGIIDADASHQKGIVTVDYDPKLVSIATITMVIEKQGFKVVS